MTRYAIQPIAFSEAAAFIAAHHRHHRPPQGHKFSLAANDGHQIIGVVAVGRPINRIWDDGATLEITRCCVLEGQSNAASFLYGAARRAVFALGYARVVTYTLISETGPSLKASGWVRDHAVAGRSWDTPTRRRTDQHPTTDKWCWASQNAKAGARLTFSLLAATEQLSLWEARRGGRRSP